MLKTNYGRGRFATRGGNSDSDDGGGHGRDNSGNYELNWGMNVQEAGVWMYHGQSPFVYSLRPNTLSSRSLKNSQALFDPTGNFFVRDPLEMGGVRSGNRITYPHPREEVMFCSLVRAGMRVPYAPRVVELLRCYGIAPALLTPHGFLKWVCFIRICKQLGIAYSLTVFRCLFQASRTPEGITGFRNRGFELKGREADARGARMRWYSMSLLEERKVDDSFHYRSSYFMYRGAALDWEVKTTERGCPTLTELTDEDIHCLRALCDCQKTGRLEPVSWAELIGLGLSDIGLQPGSWGDQGIPRALPDVGDAEYARGYEKGCQETRGCVIEQLYQYNRQFPFALIPEISSLGSSLYPASGEPREISDPRSSFESHILESSAIVLAGGSGSQEGGASHAADAGEMSVYRADTSPDSDIVARYWTEPSSDWCFLDILGASGDGTQGFPGGAYSDPNILCFDEYGQVMAMPEWMGSYPRSSLV